MDQLAQAQSIEKTGKMSDVLNSLLLPEFTPVSMTLVTVEARKRTMRSLLLVLEYHAKTGQFPKTLPKQEQMP